MATIFVKPAVKIISVIGNEPMTPAISNNINDMQHIHGISQINDLQLLLDKLETTDHSHDINEITDLRIALERKAWYGDVIDKVDRVHTHLLSDITDISSKLLEYSDITHTHTVHELPMIETIISNFREKLHNHNLQDVSNLVNELQGIESKLQNDLVILNTKQIELNLLADRIVIIQTLLDTLSLKVQYINDMIQQINSTRSDV